VRLFDPRSLPHLDARTVDRLIVLALVVGGALQSWPPIMPAIENFDRIDLVHYFGPVAIAILAPLALLFRRSRPLTVLVVTMIVLLASGLIGSEGFSPAFTVVLAVYSVGRYTSVRERSIATLIVGVGLVTALQFRAGIDLWFISTMAALVGLWLVGDTARARDERAEQLEERAARHEAEQRTSAARAAEDERGRIARELHDVIAHNVSVMVVQAAAAGRVLDHDPAQAKASLSTIESTGREALSEMRRLLGVLRAGDPAGLSDPQPSLDRLPRLVEEMRSSGLPVELAIEGTPFDLPPGVDLSAYRVIQEALTNALRHGGESPTRVIVRYASDALELEVTDDGRAAGFTPPARVGGHGLAGMRERVALVRGELEAGPRPEGGFRVRARLPVEAT
jgi:signal transduction histidine kinase